jgi:hypothetical protein
MVVIAYLRSAQEMQVMLGAQNVVRKFIEWTRLMSRRNNETPGTDEFVQLERDIHIIQDFVVRAVGQDKHEELVRYHTIEETFE